MSEALNLVDDFVYGISTEYGMELEIENSDEFYAILEENVIGVTFRRRDIEDKTFKDFVSKTFGETFDMFTLSLLHEVGHFMTLTEELRLERLMFCSILSIQHDDSEQIEKLNYAYFNIPMELEATKWAVKFYREHREYCDNFASIIRRSFI